ncbi:MAG: hypothetical protein LAP38_00295 [Acidobacteriia bacterium]|nr:hypothetical protein [Terriglobia bacterium]
MEELRSGLDALRGEVATLASEFRGFAASVESMRQDFDEPLKRLGG